MNVTKVGTEMPTVGYIAQSYLRTGRHPAALSGPLDCDDGTENEEIEEWLLLLCILTGTIDVVRLLSLDVFCELTAGRD